MSNSARRRSSNNSARRKWRKTDTEVVLRFVKRVLKPVPHESINELNELAREEFVFPGGSRTLAVPRTSTIAQALEQSGIENPDGYNLGWKGRFVDKSRNLSEYALEDGAVLELVPLGQYVAVVVLEETKTLRMWHSVRFDIQASLEYVKTSLLSSIRFPRERVRMFIDGQELSEFDPSTNLYSIDYKSSLTTGWTLQVFDDGPQIAIKPPEGCTFLLNVEPDFTLGHVANLLFISEEIRRGQTFMSAAQMLFICKGNKLFDMSQTLSALNIANGDTLHLTSRTPLVLVTSLRILPLYGDPFGVQVDNEASIRGLYETVKTVIGTPSFELEYRGQVFANPDDSRLLSGVGIVDGSNINLHPKSPFRVPISDEQQGNIRVFVSFENLAETMVELNIPPSMDGQQLRSLAIRSLGFSESSCASAVLMFSCGRVKPGEIHPQGVKHDTRLQLFLAT